MAKVRQMQGVPAHLETIKCKDKKRRHPAHCKHHEGAGKERICNNKKSQMYLLHCNSAKCCEFYEEIKE